MTFVRTSLQKATKGKLVKSVVKSVGVNVRVNLDLKLDLATFEAFFKEKIDTAVCNTCHISNEENYDCMACCRVQPRPNFKPRSSIEMYQIVSWTQLQLVFGVEPLVRCHEGKVMTVVLPVCRYTGRDEVYIVDTRAILVEVIGASCSIFIPRGDQHKDEHHEENVSLVGLESKVVLVGRNLVVPTTTIRGENPVIVEFARNTGITSLNFEFAIFSLSHGDMPGGCIH